MSTARILAACRSAGIALALILTVSSAQARGGGEGGWHGGGGGWHGGGWGWHGGGWHGGGWGWHGGGWGWGPSVGFGFGVAPPYYAPPPAYYYPPPAYYPPPYPYGGVPGYYGYGGPSTGYGGNSTYGMSMRLAPNNCGTPDEPKPCTR